MSSRAEDTRWEFLARNRWQCGGCEEWHVGLFDLGCARPDYWENGQTIEPNSAARHSTHFQSEDFCVMDDEHFFVRCVLPIPLIGAGDLTFSYGVWSSLSRVNFGIYVDGFDTGEYSDDGPWFGWFANQLTGYPDTISLKCKVHLQPDRQRPRIELEPTDHPLAVESREGIRYERLVEIYQLYGHGPRSA